MPRLEQKRCISCEVVKPRSEFPRLRTCRACDELEAKRAARVAARRLARRGQPVRWTGVCL